MRIEFATRVPALDVDLGEVSQSDDLDVLFRLEPLSPVNSTGWNEASAYGAQMEEDKLKKSVSDVVYLILHVMSTHRSRSWCSTRLRWPLHRQWCRDEKGQTDRNP